MRVASKRMKTEICCYKKSVHSSTVVEGATDIVATHKVCRWSLVGSAKWYFAKRISCSKCAVVELYSRRWMFNGWAQMYICTLESGSWKRHGNIFLQSVINTKRYMCRKRALTVIAGNFFCIELHVLSWADYAFCKSANGEQAIIVYCWASL